MNRFAFSDSSGIIKTDRFFGVGFLIVKNVGQATELLAKNYQSAYNAAKKNKNDAINYLLENNKQDEVIKILKKSRHFEMKFDYVKPSLLPYYQKMVDVFLNDRENRFSTMVIDREQPTFNGAYVHDVWESFINYAAALVLREMGNLKTDNLCLVIDEITKPNTKYLPLGDALLKKLDKKISSSNNLGLKYENIFGALVIESHSNHLMQLTDVLLGAIMYDFKKKAGLISKQTEKKKEVLVKEIRNSLKINSLAQDFTRHSPIYFSVFEAKWKKKNNTL